MGLIDISVVLLGLVVMNCASATMMQTLNCAISDVNHELEVERMVTLSEFLSQIPAFQLIER